jgi:hypothetical protein
MLTKFKQTDGKLILDRPAKSTSKLDHLFSQTSASITAKYKDEGQYLTYLLSLSKNELQEHSVYAGIIPTDNKDRLIKLLIGEFSKNKSKGSKE